MGKEDYNHTQKLVDKLFNARSAFWRDTYQQNDAHGIIVRQRQAIALKYVDELSLPKTARVLEIGCGAGLMAVALARRGFTVEAVDHAPLMVEMTQRRAKHAGMDNRIHATIEDVHELTFGDQSFDLIIALGVISWLHDLKKALLEIKRVLKHGGYVILNSGRAHALLNPMSNPAFESILERLERELERVVARNPQNVARPQAYLDREFDQYLCEMNLTIIKTTNVGFGPFKILNHDIFSDQVEVKIVQKLQHYADRGYPIIRSAGAQYVVLARKK